MRLSGFFRDTPASVVIDADSSTSSLSLSFATTHSVPGTLSRQPDGSYVHVSTGPVVVLGPRGVFVVSVPFVVETVARADVRLGRDWLTAARTTVVGETLAEASAAWAVGNAGWFDYSFNTRESVFVNRDAYSHSVLDAASLPPLHLYSFAQPVLAGFRDWSSNETMLPSALPGVTARDYSRPMLDVFPGERADAGSSDIARHERPDAGLRPGDASDDGDDQDTDSPQRSLYDTVDRRRVREAMRLVLSGSTACLDSPGFNSCPRATLVAMLHLHGLPASKSMGVEHLRTLLTCHIADGDCVLRMGDACRAACSRLPRNVVERRLHLRAADFKRMSRCISRLPLIRLLEVLKFTVDKSSELKALRKQLRQCSLDVSKGKHRELIRLQRARHDDSRPPLVPARAAEIAAAWPQPPSVSLKEKLVRMFREETSSAALTATTCAVCGAATVQADIRESLLVDLPLDLLLFTAELRASNPSLVAPYTHPVHGDLLLDGRGIDVDDGGHATVRCCSSCHLSLARRRLPALSYANGLYLGAVPPELQDLTIVEEAIISRCRAKAWVVHLRADGSGGALASSQRALRGNIVIHPQRPDALCRVLPPPMEDVLNPICVIFVGSQKPTKEWLRTKAKPLAVRRARVMAALQWLKAHNPLYADVAIDVHAVNALPVNDVLDYHVEVLPPSDAQAAATSGYQSVDESSATASGPTDLPAVDSALPESESADNTDESIPFHTAVIADVDVHSPASDLRAAAVRHFKEKGGGFVSIGHEPSFMNEFFDPSLFPLLYPTLFPFGVGGFEDRVNRKERLSMKRHVKHLFNCSDRRFQNHYSFLFIIFNLLQRRQILLRAGLKVKKASFGKVAANFAALNPEAISRICQRAVENEGKPVKAYDEAERKVLALMREVKLVSSSVPGSPAARQNLRNNVRGLMIEHGLPSFFLTINPADIYNPVVKLLGGADIDVDSLPLGDVPDYREQSVLVARNPFVAAKFFNLYMKAFIKCLLGFDQKTRRSTDEGGVLGHTKAYFGCVEAQGRGTLHCHMLVWLEGSLNPNEIRERLVVGQDAQFGQRLLAYLDDTISSGIPDLPPVQPHCSEHYPYDSPVHPCKIRGVSLASEPDVEDYLRNVDRNRLAKACQTHKHSFTCYKYCRDGEKECRFGLSEANICPTSFIDPATGSVHQQCLDGLVNNFNMTILEAMRCNMDIKFIGSGDAAKAILYYITDYITKADLKTHVAFAALELAVRKLNEQIPGESESAFRAKRMLQKCAFAMLTQQELSAPQVISSLVDFEDFFSSDRFAYLYWTSFERYVENLLPSPECQTSVPESGHKENPTLLTNAEDLSDSDSDWSSDNGEDVNEFDLDEPGGVENLAGNDVAAEVNDEGELCAFADRVSDYLYRPGALSACNVWDFTRSFTKIPIRARTQNSGDNDDYEPAEDDSQSTDEQLRDDSDTDEELEPALPLHLRLQQPHPESNKYHLRRLRELMKPTLVPVGPAFPRRDKVDVYARYCRLMLVLFKPWRTILDLKPVETSWTEAFDAWTTDVSEVSKGRMDNMQILHECKDCRDEHYQDRFRRRRHGQISAELTDGASTSEWPGATDDDLEAFLDAYDQHSDLISGMSPSERQDMEKCVRITEQKDLFGLLLGHHASGEGKARADEEATHVVFDTGDEKDWTATYQIRKLAWRQQLKSGRVSGELSQEHVSTLNGEHIEQWYQEAYPVGLQPGLPAVTEASVSVDGMVEEMIQEFTLNTDQAYAFKLLAMHSAQDHPIENRLRMFLGGPGGSGKSQVIKTLKAFFDRRNDARRFRLASFTGVAARNISGMTLHSCLMIDQRHVNREDLAAIWDGVEYLVIDEVSMVGCHLLAQISKALSLAKGLPDVPFGGINLIFAGDFAQLPPVGQRRLYAYMDSSQSKFGQSARSQSELFGRLLWLSINCVVLLSTSMRQRGSENEDFVALLTRLRDGRCSHTDWLTLTNRILSGQVNRMDKEDWVDAPTIVSSNATKDAMNLQAVEAYAQATGKPLHWYHSVDRTVRKAVLTPRIRERLASRHSGATNQRLGKLPLVLGMRILVATNFDVPGGVVNGSIGILKRIRYTVNDSNERVLKSCIVYLPDASSEAVPGLPANWYPIMPDETAFTLSKGRGKGQCTIKRKQVPLQPAYAFTAHRAQGQTYSHVVVDLQGCKSLEAVYVMVSRAKSLDGLVILRPFDVTKLQRTLDNDRRQEYDRLYMLSLYTAMQHGEQSRRAAAWQALHDGRESNLPRIDHIPATTEEMVTLLQHHQLLPFTIQASRAGKRKLDARYKPISNGKNKRQRLD